MGRLVGVGPRRGSKLLCACDCGVKKYVTIGSLIAGFTKSCGCLRKEWRQRHGNISTRAEYGSWHSMLQRCTNPRSTEWPRYGGQGIKVHPTWVKSFDAFIADVGRRPSKHYSIDRFPDAYGDYKPGNVRWATRKQQRANRRTHFKKVTMPLGPASNVLLFCSSRDGEGKPCPERALARGLCRRHYQQRWNKNQLPPKDKKPKSVSFTIRLPERMHAALTKQSRATGKTLVTLIEQSISTQLQMFGLWPPKD